MGRLPTLEEAFHTAMVDAINIYVREALGRGGFLTPDYHAGVGADQLLRAKHDLARELAARWVRFRFDSDGNPIGVGRGLLPLCPRRRPRRCSGQRGQVGFPRLVAHSAPAAAELGRSAAEGFGRTGHLPRGKDADAGSYR